MGQAVIEIVQACVSAHDQTFGDSSSRCGTGFHLLLDDLRQPAFSVPDVDDRVRAVINDGLLRNPHTSCTVHETRASLWRQQLNRAEAALRAESISARNAAPRHDVHTGENLPGELRRLRRLECEPGDEIEKEMSVHSMTFPATHLVPEVGCHLDLDVSAGADLGERDEIVECGFACAFHSEEPLELMSFRFRGDETVEVMLVEGMRERRSAIPRGEFGRILGKRTAGEVMHRPRTTQHVVLPWNFQFAHQTTDKWMKLIIGSFVLRQA